MAFSQEYKLADYFAVIGLDEQLKSIESSQDGKYPHFRTLSHPSHPDTPFIWPNAPLQGLRWSR